MSRGRGKEAANATSQPEDQGLSWVIFRAASQGVLRQLQSRGHRMSSWVIFRAMVMGCPPGSSSERRSPQELTEAWGSEWWEVPACIFPSGSVGALECGCGRGTGLREA